MSGRVDINLVFSNATAHARDAWCYGDLRKEDFERHADRIEHARAAVSALVEALKNAREYVTSELSRERDTFKGHENCSDIPAIERDLAQIDAALLAAGEVL